MAGASCAITSCVSSRRHRFCSVAAFVSALLVIALGGCGDDEEGGETEPARSATAPAQTDTLTLTSTAPSETAPAETAPAETNQDEPASPEDQAGGAGDEVPARSQARFTGHGGQIRPRVVLVPPFIAIRVELRSADRRAYSLTAGGRTLRADSDVSSVTAVFDGLRPGRRIVLRGTGGRVIVEASAEPGP